MRAERPGATGSQEPAAGRAEGFERAMRRAREGEGREGRRATGARSPHPHPHPHPTPDATTTPAATSNPAANPTATASPTGGASRASELAARAVALVSALREGGRPALLIAAADGLRYEVAGGPAGVELRALAPPLLERVARVDLHAVAIGCDRRGLRLLRTTVRVEAGGGGGAAAGKR